jgi:hypothetical protein
MSQGESEHDQLEAEQGQAAEPFRNLADYLDARLELGLGNMLMNLALEPRDAFKPKQRRRAKKGFVIAVFFFMAFAAWFAWFNVIR